MSASTENRDTDLEAQFSNIKISRIDAQLDVMAIREILNSHFARFGIVNVHIVNDGLNPTIYVNFESPQDARRAWKDVATSVCQLLGIASLVEPAGLEKSHCSSFKEDKRSRSSSSLGVPAACADKSATDEFGGWKEPNRELFSAFRLTMCMPEEKQSVRVLFVGRLKSNITVRSQQTLYILYEKKECAMEACNALKGKLIDDGKTDKRFEVDFVDPNLMDKYASVGRILVPPGSEFNGRSCGHVQSYRAQQEQV